MENLANIIFSVLFIGAGCLLALDLVPSIWRYCRRCIIQRRLILPKLNEVAISGLVIGIVLSLAFSINMALISVQETTVKGEEVGLFVHLMRYMVFGALGILFVAATGEILATAWRHARKQ